MDKHDRRNQHKSPFSRLHIKLLGQFVGSRTFTDFIEPLLSKKTDWTTLGAIDALHSQEHVTHKWQWACHSQVTVSMSLTSACHSQLTVSMSLTCDSEHVTHNWQWAYHSQVHVTHKWQWACHSQEHVTHKWRWACHSQEHCHSQVTVSMSLTSDGEHVTHKSCQHVTHKCISLTGHVCMFLTSACHSQLTVS